MYRYLILSLLLVGCGASRQEQLVVKRSVDERLQMYATVLADLNTREEAKPTRIELDRAAAWLRRAETLGATTEGASSSRMKVLLDVIDGQLVRIKAEQGRQAAVQRLEGERGRFEVEMGRFESIQKKNAELREGGAQ